MLVTTGRSEPLAYIRLTDADISLPIKRSNCALVCQVWATVNSGSMAQGDWTAAVPLPQLFGNGGAPADVPLRVHTGARGDPESCSACSYPPRIGWSYMMPVLPRRTVLSLTDHATPTRGPKLFRSVLKLCVCASGASAMPSGYLYRSYRTPYRILTAGLICQSSCTNALNTFVLMLKPRSPVTCETDV